MKKLRFFYLQVKKRTDILFVRKNKGLVGFVRIRPVTNRDGSTIKNSMRDGVKKLWTTLNFRILYCPLFIDFYECLPVLSIGLLGLCRKSYTGKRSILSSK